MYAKGFSNRPKWLPGEITAVNGSLSYEVTLDDRHVIRCHVDHLKSRTATTSSASSERPDDWVPDLPFPALPTPTPTQLVLPEFVALVEFEHHLSVMPLVSAKGRGKM